MMVLTQAIISAIFGAFSDKIIKKLDEIKPKEIQIVNVKQDPNSYSLSELDKVTTINQKWTNKDNPIMQFENPLEESTVVKEIDIVPDTNFKTLGKLIITIDDVDVFKSKSFTSFEDISENVIKVNKVIKKDSKVKFFLISSDGTAVGISAQVTFGD